MSQYLYVYVIRVIFLLLQLLYHQQSAATLQETLSQIESDQEPQKPIMEYFNDIRSLSIIGNPT